MPLEIELRRQSDEIVARFGSLESRADVADLLEIPELLLKRILYIRQEPGRYRHFSVRKRNGDLRRISVPPPSLAILQKKLNQVFQLVYKKKHSVHGFVRGRSILTNARGHVGKRWVLNVDLSDFFPSINFGRVRGALMAAPYAIRPSAGTVIAQICCTEDGLPQGAPSSPMLSNIVCGRMDGELGALARRFHAKYTRYGDDITFSLRQYEFPQELARALTGWSGAEVEVGSTLLRIIESNGFAINRAKTRLQLRDCRQEVTGICVNVFPNVTRATVREVRAMLHAWERYGEEAAEREFLERFAKPDRRPGAGRLVFRRVVKGKLDFIQMVRGRNDPVYVKLRAKLHALEPAAISPPPIALPRSGRSIRGVGTDPGWTRWYQRLGQSIFHLEIRTDLGTNAGTAFAYRIDQLATAAHNLVGQVRVLQSGGPINAVNWDCHGRFESAGVDCALIHQSHDATPLSIAPHRPVPGEPLAIIGFASVPRRHPRLGVYSGIVESINPNYQGVDIIHVSVPSAGGLSGSPVINSAGQVVGIVIESTFEQTQSGVPGREFCSVLPIEHLSEVRR